MIKACPGHIETLEDKQMEYRVQKWSILILSATSGLLTSSGLNIYSGDKRNGVYPRIGLINARFP